MPVFGGLEERPNLWVERAHQGDFLPFLFGCFYVVIVRRFLGLQSCGSSVWTSRKMTYYMSGTSAEMATSPSVAEILGWLGQSFST